MRITGLATGLDMDQLVKETMQPYRIKIQVQQQKKEILEIKQKLYRDVINDCREFYNKYFDLAKSDSILLEKNWNTIGFSSSSDSVTVTATNGAKVGNYTITGTTATAAKAVIAAGDLGNTIVVNGKEFTVEGSTDKEKAEKLNEKFKEAGINVSVKYTDFANSTVGNNNKRGFVFESTVLGKDGVLSIGGDIKSISNGKDGSDSTAANITGIEVEELLKAGVSINGKDIKVETPAKGDWQGATAEEKLKAINKALGEQDLVATLDENDNTKLIIKSKTLGELAADKIPEIKINGISVGVFENGKDATQATNEIEFNDLNGKISVNGKMIDLSKKEANESTAEYINKVLKEQGEGITATEDANGNITLVSNKSGDGKIEIKKISNDNDSTKVSFTNGTDADILIKDENGGIYSHKGNSNTITLDGITFNFKGKISPGEEIKITGKNDITAVKDKLVNFINDYNKVMVKLNTLLNEKRDSSYMPLTDEQKEAMSENEVKLWNEKVEKGQLRRDSDLTRIANSMKTAMRSVMDGNNLEKFGIEPVSDYQGTKNGTFTVNEDKLTSALENNLEEIMNLFIGTNDDKSKRGIAQQLKDILYSETVTTSSSLIKKAGIEGSATVSNNELTKQITKYTQKMEDMEKDFSRREQLLYSKWASIEKMMNNLNSQQSYFSSMLGY